LTAKVVKVVQQEEHLAVSPEFSGSQVIEDRAP